MRTLEEACFSVIAYFSYFRYPLTAFEVWKWLYAPSQQWSLPDVMTALTEGEWLAERITEWNGFYGIGDVEGAWRDRHTRYLDAMRKYRTLFRVASAVGRVAAIEGIAVCNSLAFHHTNEKSDIDLFIIAEKDRAWTARLFAVSMMALLRRRPGEAERDPVCCSFFVDTTATDISAFAFSHRDRYLAYWTATLIPIVTHGDVFDDMRGRNPWLHNVLPNAQPVRRAFAFRKNVRRRFPWHGVSEVFARQFQEKRFSPVVQAMQNVDTRVVVNNHVLKFHENDRRAAIAHAHEEKVFRV